MRFGAGVFKKNDSTVVILFTGFEPRRQGDTGAQRDGNEIFFFVSMCLVVDFL
ncbi:MAG: hypothetical protein JWM28_1989 [Chitinophagaceae bacterium]|nr:hypothetical protein [Chitinophagaceae bacterium]